MAGAERGGGDVGGGAPHEPQATAPNPPPAATPAGGAEREEAGAPDDPQGEPGAPDDPQGEPAPPSTAELRVDLLYKDAFVVVVSKPAGLLIHRSEEAADRDALLQRTRDLIGQRVYPVHRLDRPCSGLVLFALDPATTAALQATWHQPTTRKDYLALVRGSAPDAWEDCTPLHNDRKQSQEARTDFVKLAEFSRCSLLRARLHTGRRHQIRRHLAKSARQILGDSNYGKGRINAFFREQYGLPRLFLHSWQLELVPPWGGEKLTIRSPLADDLRAFLARLPDLPPGLLETL